MMQGAYVFGWAYTCPFIAQQLAAKLLSRANEDSVVQAIFVASKGFLYSHRNIQPGQLSVLLQIALESPCGLNILTGIWAA